MREHSNKALNIALSNKDINAFFEVAATNTNIQEYISSFTELAVSKNDLPSLKKIFNLPNIAIFRHEQLTTIAIANQYQDIIDFLLTIPFVQFKKWSGLALSEAASTGDLNTYNRLINLGCTKESWFSDFMFAAATGKLDISNYILTFVKPSKEELTSMVHLTIMHGNLSSLQYIEKLGANLKKDLNDHLKSSIFSKNIPIIDYLLSLGADIQYEKHITIISTIQEGKTQLLQHLIGKGIKIEKQLQNGMIMAAKMGHVHMIKLLYQHGGDINLALKHISKNKEELLQYSIAMEEKKNITDSLEHINLTPKQSKSKI